MDELKTLFDKNKKYKIGWMTKVHLTNLITLSDVWLWSWASESGGLEFADFNFDEGTKYWYSRSPEDELRTLPVRSVK